MAGKPYKTIWSIGLFGILAAGICHGQEESTNAADEPEVYDRSRYEVIVERSPFGADPLIDDEEKKNAAAAKALEREYRLCFLLESQSGEVRAGFQNKKPKKGDPKSMMLAVGESRDSMKLINIDLKNSSATVQYQGKEVVFELEKAVAAAKPAAPKTPAPPQRRFGGGFRRTTPPPEPVPQPAPEPEVSPEELAAQREAIQESLRDYQMEVIREGMPPLPIQLTPEQDDQLVAEGVLPPLEE